MRRVDSGPIARWWVTLGVMVCLVPCVAAEEPAFRYRAAITVERPAAFVQLPLPASVYARSAQAGLQDLRIVDARGERVPFAMLAPRAGETRAVEQARDVVLYALPRGPVAGQPWALPVEVVVQGDRISVRRPAGPAGSRTAPSGSASASAPPDSPGWLIDTGDPRQRPSGEGPPQTLRLSWSGPAEFSASFEIETSSDLRTWRAGGSGQLLALASPGGPLTQPAVVLPPEPGRFVRLVWADPAAAPRITGAQAIAVEPRRLALDAPTALEFTAAIEPAGKTPADLSAGHALFFDLGGLLPVAEVDLRLAPGQRIAPVRLQGRSSADQPWRDVGQRVFYRLERGNTVSVSPPLPLSATVRHLRVLPDERSAALDPARTRLLVQAHLASLVFAPQGQAPFMLLAGAAHASPGALPASTLVPSLDEERERFGRATLGDWHEVEAVARQAAAAQRQAALRPWLLWAVLLLGMSGLGFMVWRLVRGRS